MVSTSSSRTSLPLEIRRPSRLFREVLSGPPCEQQYGYGAVSGWRAGRRQYRTQSSPPGLRLAPSATPARVPHLPKGAKIHLSTVLTAFLLAASPQHPTVEAALAALHRVVE